MQKPCETSENESQGLLRKACIYGKNAKTSQTCEGLGGSRSIHLSYGDESCIFLPSMYLNPVVISYTGQGVHLFEQVEAAFVLFPN
jgi:hypothetical protein